MKKFSTKKSRDVVVKCCDVVVESCDVVVEYGDVVVECAKSIVESDDVVVENDDVVVENNKVIVEFAKIFDTKSAKSCFSQLLYHDKDNINMQLFLQTKAAFIKKGHRKNIYDVLINKC